jgi:tetratricopeptide (TPR) repeat protein
MNKEKIFNCSQLFFLRAALFFILACSFSCHHPTDKIEPQLSYSLQDKYLLSLPSAFKPLTEGELKEDWSKEYRVGIGFAHELDLYQAITAFKRADFLINTHNTERRKEINYGIFLCYYLGRKYQDALYIFEQSPLAKADTSFAAASDLLTLVFDCYSRIGDELKAKKMLMQIQQYFPESAEKLYVYSSLLSADTNELSMIAKHENYSYLTGFLESYSQNKKSVQTAKILNASIPGAGYFYLGQTQSGITALLLNGLFIGASYYFFDHGNIPAGAIFTSFEAGWYFGGIYGAGQEAKFYNERLYEKMAAPMMNEHGLFPGFMIKYAF